MKDPKVVSFSPHVPLDGPEDPCARLLLRARPHDGPAHGPPRPPAPAYHMSVRELLATLAGIEETVLLYQGERGGPVPGG